MANIIPYPVDRLENALGQYIAGDVFSLDGKRMLLNVNSEITPRVIEALKGWNIDSVWVSPERVLPSEKKKTSKGNDLFRIQRSKKILSLKFKEVVNELSSKVNLRRDSLENVSASTVQKVQKAIDQVIEDILNNPTALFYIELMDEKDPYLLRHSSSVTFLLLSLSARYPELRMLLRSRDKGVLRFENPRSRRPGWDLRGLGLSGMLHDIGIIPILDIVNKDVTFKEDDPVWEQIRAHPKIGHEALFGKKVDPHALLGIKYHHENYDGSGYSLGIKGEKIHVYARMIRIVDSFQAAISPRPGKEAKSVSEICAEMKSLSGSIYDPEILGYFLDLVSNAEKI